MYLSITLFILMFPGFAVANTAEYSWNMCLVYNIFILVNYLHEFSYILTGR